MKGIILAGGSGTRLYPLTQTVSKQLLPVYDKPTIYYPLSTVMLAGIRDILIISTPRDTPMIQGLLGDGSELGLRLSYKVQAEPKGIPQAFTLGAEFIGGDSVCMILGDNLFYGTNLGDQLERSFSGLKDGGCIFAYRVSDPHRYGVVEFDAAGKIVSVEEKPKAPKSNWAITGLYMFDNEVVKIASNLKPSPRGETEITDVIQAYHSRGKLKVQVMGRGTAWLDTGTPDSLMSSGQFVQAIEKRQGLKIACIEEVALHKKFITLKQFEALAEKHGKSEYGDYLRQVAKQLDDLPAGLR